MHELLSRRLRHSCHDMMQYEAEMNSDHQPSNSYWKALSCTQTVGHCFSLMFEKVLRAWHLSMQSQEEDGPDNQLINSVYLDNSSMELYHGRLDKKPNALAIRIRFASDRLGKDIKPKCWKRCYTRLLCELMAWKTWAALHKQPVQFMCNLPVSCFCCWLQWIW